MENGEMGNNAGEVRIKRVLSVSGRKCTCSPHIKGGDAMKGELG